MRTILYTFETLSKTTKFGGILWQRYLQNMEQNRYKVNFRRKLNLNVPFFPTAMDAPFRSLSDNVSMLVQKTHPNSA